ncbi:hypothetical protein KP509_13G000400 [Ceratopteris richardii]|uniref:Uncharacterized protein n=1 Tax=Ceratopteris richardii TaxID=49495 RepID=A0A8T2TCW3_CERRI|nr:hypothetical protein KP509_13G000400 [Ceratopteris richardii]
MYSAEFYKRCNIRLPELFSQAVHQRQEGTFVLLNTKDVPSIRLFRARKYYSCHFKGQKWASSRKISRISASADLSPDDAAYMRFLGDDSQENGSGVYFGKATSKDELIALRESAARASLLKKLSDANIYGRHLQRQLREKEDALMKCKNELETMSDDIQLLVGLAQEIVKGGVQPGTRKINGKYIHSHLALTLKDIHGRLLEQVNNIEGACYRDVSLVWYGLAEVQVESCSFLC